MTKHPLCLTEDEVVALGKRNHPPYSVLAEAFLCMLNDDMRSAKLWHSDVYFVREALRKRTGFFFPLDKVAAAMKAEGWREASKRIY